MIPRNSSQPTSSPARAETTRPVENAPIAVSVDSVAHRVSRTRRKPHPGPSASSTAGVPSLNGDSSHRSRLDALRRVSVLPGVEAAFQGGCLVTHLV